MPSLNVLLKTTPKPSFTKCSGFASVWVLILLVLMFGILGTFGYLFLNRLTEIEQRMVGLDQQMEEVVQKVEEAIETSKAASLRALQAEEHALEAARGRAQAEEDKREAEQDKQKAVEEANLAKLEAQSSREEADRIRREREEEMRRLQEALNQIVDTRRTALGLVMNLGNDFIQFDFDKATLRPKDREILATIAGVLLTSKQYQVQIFGHTDDIGSEEHNLKLSEKRAQTVRNYLIDAGINPAIISTKGFGNSNPLVAGTSPEVRQKNRRVEIGIIDTVITYEKTAPSE